MKIHTINGLFHFASLRSTRGVNGGGVQEFGERSHIILTTNMKYLEALHYIISQLFMNDERVLQ